MIRLHFSKLTRGLRQTQRVRVYRTEHVIYFYYLLWWFKLFKSKNRKGSVSFYSSHPRNAVVFLSCTSLTDHLSTYFLFFFFCFFQTTWKLFQRRRSQLGLGDKDQILHNDRWNFISIKATYMMTQQIFWKFSQGTFLSASTPDPTLLLTN